MYVILCPRGQSSLDCFKTLFLQILLIISTAQYMQLLQRSINGYLVFLLWFFSSLVFFDSVKVFFSSHTYTLAKFFLYVLLHLQIFSSNTGQTLRIFFFKYQMETQKIFSSHIFTLRNFVLHTLLHLTKFFLQILVRHFRIFSSEKCLTSTLKIFEPCLRLVNLNAFYIIIFKHTAFMEIRFKSRMLL